MPKKISSEPQACAKCLKKYGPNLIDWEPCKNCSWVTKEIKTENDELFQQKKTNEKCCIECQETLNFLELEKGKYLCGKNKCLRTYIEKKSEKK